MNEVDRLQPAVRCSARKAASLRLFDALRCSSTLLPAVLKEANSSSGLFSPATCDLLRAGAEPGRGKSRGLATEDGAPHRQPGCQHQAAATGERGKGTL